MRPEDHEIKNPVVKEFFSRAKAEGEARGLARALLEVLERRGIEVDEALSKEVLACRDEAQLCAWIDKAIEAKKLADVFD